MNSKDIVDKLMGEWEAAKMDTPHGLPAFKEAADEIKRLREENESLTQRLVVCTVNENRKLQGEVDRLRGLIREVLGASYCTVGGVIVTDETMLKIEEEVRNELK